MLNNSLHLIINKILHYNEGSLNLLKAYSGHSFKINFSGFRLSGLIAPDGLLSQPENEIYNVEISILPSSVITYLINRDELATFKQINFTGDASFGRELLEIFSNLHLSGISNGMSPAALFILTQLNKALNSIKSNLGLLSYNMSNSISEYLLYESEDLVTRYEIEEFCNAIDDLTDRTDLLYARINLLSRPQI